MVRQNTQFDFANNLQPTTAFSLFHHIITDRGSRYSVSIGRVTNRREITQFLFTLRSQASYDTATHHSYAVRISRQGTIYETKQDDGEAGAGYVILRLMQQHPVSNCIICVSRWFGGTKLMNDRYTHIQSATRYALCHGALK